MSHRFTFFTLPTACAVSCWVGLFCLLVLCCFGCVWFPVLHVRQAFFLTIVAHVLGRTLLRVLVFGTLF